jgi:ribosomal protein S18 acetylase RimI-like enzyme
MPDPSGANQPVPHPPPLPGRRTSQVPVRSAVPEDAARLAEINVEAWRHAYDGIVPTTYLRALDVATTRERWQERIVKPPRDRVCLVAEIAGEVAAYAIGGAYRTQQDADPGEDTAGWGELYAIYTHPALQGRGAGSAVHDAVLAALAERGFSAAALWVLRANARTIGWYGDRRWRPDGALSRWLGAGEPLEEIRLVRDLQDVVPAPRAGPGGA